MKRKPRERQEELLARCLGMVTLANYEMWKERSNEVLRREPPTKKKVLLATISELKERGDLVEARDRFLMEPEKVPKENNSVQEMEDWIRCVQASRRRANRACQEWR